MSTRGEYSAGPRVHGGPIDGELRALGIDARSLADFSVNVNPYGPCRPVVEAIRNAASADLHRYPDPTGLSAREALARTFDVPAGEIVLGNGAAELLWSLARTLLRPETTALIVEPTFCELRAAALAIGARVIEWRARHADGFQIDLPAIAKLAREEAVRLVYLCCPNTPTGAGLAATEIALWAEGLAPATIILDQSFLSLSDRATDAGLRMPRNVVRVRSLTKDHAIPGIRVGYLLAPPELARAVEAQRPAWSTSALAQAAVIAACRESEFVEASRRRLATDRATMISMMRQRGLAPLASEAPFFLLPVARASEVRAVLLARHLILVRDCASFGLPKFVRVAARPAPEGERLAAALADEINRC